MVKKTGRWWWRRWQDRWCWRWQGWWWYCHPRGVDARCIRVIPALWSEWQPDRRARPQSYVKCLRKFRFIPPEEIPNAKVYVYTTRGDPWILASMKVIRASLPLSGWDQKVSFSKLFLVVGRSKASDDRSSFTVISHHKSVVCQPFVSSVVITVSITVVIIVVIIWSDHL